MSYFPHLFARENIIFAPCMNFTTFLNETPLWILIPLALVYAICLGYFVYIGIRLFRE